MGHEGRCRGTWIRCCCLPTWKEFKARAEEILRRAGGRPGHIFNFGHGILPETPVENVKALAAGYSGNQGSSTVDLGRVACAVESTNAENGVAVLFLAHGSPDSVDEIPEFLNADHRAAGRLRRK